MRPGLRKLVLFVACIAAGVAGVSLLLNRNSTSVLGSSAPPPPPPRMAPKTTSLECLPSGDGFFRARLDGALEKRLDWGNSGTLCEGMPRPDGKGIRLSFRRSSADEPDLLVVIGIAGLSESSSGRALAANVTIIEESSSRVFSTRGDDKCTVDELRQELMTPWRAQTRSYRVSGRGFCIEPASAVGREGTVLMSTFDFAGRATYEDHPVNDREGPA